MSLTMFNDILYVWVKLCLTMFNDSLTIVTYKVCQFNYV